MVRGMVFGDIYTYYLLLIYHHMPLDCNLIGERLEQIPHCVTDMKHHKTIIAITISRRKRCLEPYRP
jgi:hypothetical protein